MMNLTLGLRLGVIGGALSISFLSYPAMAEDILKFGVSSPMSGAAANWGIGCDWVGQKVVKYINDHGGIRAGGKVYKVQLTTYDNGYTAAGGAQSAQAMISRDGVRYIVQSLGTAPVQATQSLSERAGVILLTTAWGKSIKGPKFPLTFTNSNTPYEIFGPLFAFVRGRHPDIKSVALLNPNDSTGQQAEAQSKQEWAKLGVKVVSSSFYERGTTEFQSIATKLANAKTDAVDLGGSAPGDAGSVFKELSVQGWNGVKVYPAGTGSDTLVKVGGKSVEGVYMGQAADFSGATATALQRDLDSQAKQVLHEPLNILQMGVWDGMMALKAGIEKADSIDPKAVAKSLPTTTVETSYGPVGYGGKATYGTPQQLLVPVIITQIRNGSTLEVRRVASPDANGS
ncbi:branched-chain amino acid transport system substrate-binding protein [Caballeronia udeis]|uniref:Branched-chain amino acid transport system substrate-binding protein n=1 Tax=Caballeronia udeis TaxID=1232866 RepID=A0ABW8MQR5_9BURK